MKRYLLVDSRDLQEYSGSDFILQTATGLKKQGNEVTLYLIENGVLAARKGATIAKQLSETAKAGVKVLAEDSSLQTRGVTALADGVASATIDTLADLVLDGSDQVIWY